MAKLILILALTAFTSLGLSSSEVPLPGPGAPPTEPPPPQPTPPVLPTPTPPPGYPNPGDPYPPQNPGDEAVYHLGSGRVGRFKERHFNFRPPAGLDTLRALRITCTNSKIKIVNVRIHYETGQSYDHPSLRGVYHRGDARRGDVWGARVLRVTVTASSPSVFSSKGAFRLDALATRTRAKDTEQSEYPVDGLDYTVEITDEE